MSTRVYYLEKRMIKAVLVIVWLLVAKFAYAGGPSSRSNIESFKVMDVMAAAVALEQQGEHIIHLEVGQPSTGGPQKVLQAAEANLRKDKIGYTNANGIDALRMRIVKHYKDTYNCDIEKERIIITTGSSAAFIFAFLGCFDAGENVALCSSGYPCYRNDLKALGLNDISVKVNSEYKVTAIELQQEIDRRKELGLSRIAGFICSSPSNPTGAMLTPTELKEITALCEKEDITFISDEIYHGITYGNVAQSTAVEHSNEAIVVNSFSKYYSMTGWRLGWMVVPSNMVDTMNRLSQNLYINAPTLSQLAGIEAFDCQEELDGHVRRYAENRGIVLATLSELDLLSGASPADGAFYVYIDLSSKGITDAPALCTRLLNEAKIAITPGVDFESPESGLGLQRIRISYSRSTEEVREGMVRFKAWWMKNVVV